MKHEENPRDALAAADVGAFYNSEGHILDAEALTVIGNWLHEHARNEREKSSR
jgi:hypothetical protein